MKSKEEKRKELVDQLEKYLVRLAGILKRSSAFLDTIACRSNILRMQWGSLTTGTLILSFNVKFKIPTHKLA